MKTTNLVLDTWKHMSLLGIAMLGITLPDTSPAQAPEHTYGWSAELVAFDAAANTVTVKSLVVAPEGRQELSGLSAGDRVTVAWSGLRSAAGVRAVRRNADASLGRLTLPAEFVATEMDGRYVTFKVRIPAESAAAIKNLSPGAWVSATSRLGATDGAEAVESIRPYING